MSNVNTSVVKAAMRLPAFVLERAVTAASVQRGEARHRRSSSDMLLNPVALLVESCKD